jgi:hypothetical protein
MGEVSLYHCTIDWFGISCMTTENVCYHLQNRLIQTSQTGGQRYSDTSPFSISWTNILAHLLTSVMVFTLCPKSLQSWAV